MTKILDGGIQFDADPFTFRRELPTKSTQAVLRYCFAGLDDFLTDSNSPAIDRESTKDMYEIPVDPAFMTDRIRSLSPNTTFGSMNVSITRDMAHGSHTTVFLRDGINKNHSLTLSEVESGVMGSSFRAYNTAPATFNEPSKGSESFVAHQDVFQFLDRQVRGIDQMLEPSFTIKSVLASLHARSRSLCQTKTAVAEVFDYADITIDPRPSKKPDPRLPLLSLQSHQRIEQDSSGKVSHSKLIWLMGRFPQADSRNGSAHSLERILLATNGANKGELQAFYELSSDPKELGGENLQSFGTLALHKVRTMTTTHVINKLKQITQLVKKLSI